MISLLRIRNREEAKLVLIGAVVVYRNFVEQTLADAQKKLGQVTRTLRRSG
ncbi:RolB family protein [Rhizobium nepotum]|uniref:RolB family protein n=1 Tax=Rhizobium nepotum TaxID=1035271 RepID=UPI003CE83FD2